MNSITIRPEFPQDIDAIRALHYRAFNNHPQHAPGAEPTEHLIVAGLRDAGVLALSLVAVDTTSIAGHCALSPVLIDNAPARWLGLGPIGVLPESQGQGIGSTLMRAAIERTQGMGMEGIILVGDPGFYKRFGFRSGTALSVPGVPRPNVLALPFGNARASGNVAFHPAFFEKA